MDLSKLANTTITMVDAAESPPQQPSPSCKPTGNNSSPTSAFPVATLAMMDYSQQVRSMQHQQMYAAEVARYNRYMFPAQQATFPTMSLHPQLQFPAAVFPGYGSPAGPYGQFLPGYPRGMLQRFLPYREELPKPTHSYIGLIGMAILSSPDKKMILSDIYQWIQDHYPYFKSRPQGWKNSIRHNLSLNACFRKDGRSATGKGHFWAIHPANVKDFERGDFRRRKAQQKVHRMMGIAVPDDDDEDDDDSPCPSLQDDGGKIGGDVAAYNTGSSMGGKMLRCTRSASPPKSSTPEQQFKESKPGNHQPRKRTGFDMDSLLAPDLPTPDKPNPISKKPDVSILRSEENNHEDNQQHVSRFTRVSSSSLNNNINAATHPHSVAQLIDNPGQLPVVYFHPHHHHHHHPSTNGFLQQGCPTDITPEKWTQSFARIMARSYPNKAPGNP